MKEIYLPRTLEKVIRRATDSFKVIMVSGMRQTGKSTLLRHLAEEEGSIRRYVTLDSQRMLDFAKDSPGDFFSFVTPKSTVDEIQLAPGLFRSLKEKVDKTPERGQYWLSGSQRLELMAGVTDALPGRLVPLELMPLSIYEREGRGLEQEPWLPALPPAGRLTPRTPEDAWEIIFEGGWPGSLGLGAEDRERYFEALRQTYLARDVSALSRVDRVDAFRRFLTALAARTGQELRLQPLAQAAGVSVPTVNRWLSIARSSGVIWYLRPFSANIGKQLVKSPKVYFSDTGLAASLLGIRSPEELSRHASAGSFFETFAVNEVLKGWVHNGKVPDFFFYRDNRGMEIDLLIRKSGLLYPVEVKAKSHPDSHDAKWIKAFREALPGVAADTAAILSLTDEPYAVGPGIVVQNVWSI